jgi:O-antigen/teichoic acid export membrane protein
MSVLRRNVLANLLGTGWLALLQILVVPVYVGLIGVEGFAIIGFHVTLQAAFRILELGLTPTINREFARYGVRPEAALEARDFTRTFAAIYWMLGLVAGGIVWLAAPLLATRWLDAGRLAPEVLTAAIRSMGLLIGLQFPVSFYQGGLLGLERQVLLNTIKAATSTMLAVAGVFVLARVEASVTAFLWSQVAVTVIQVGLMRTMLWRALPRTDRPSRIVPALATRLRAFTAGVSAITVCSLVLTQGDKLVLSKLLPLEDFGYYMLVSVLAPGLAVIHAPVFNALFPRLSALVASDRRADIPALFRMASQWIAVATMPASVVIALFAHPIMLIWTRNSTTAAVAAPLLSVLIVGHALNGLMSLPYALQLAHGWTSLALRLNVALAAVLVPALLVAVGQFGVIGAAGVWLAINVVYVAIGIPIVHARLLGGRGGRWFLDVTRATLAALVVAGLWRLLPGDSLPVLGQAAIVAGAACTATAAAAIASPDVRHMLWSWLLARAAPAASTGAL